MGRYSRTVALVVASICASGCADESISGNLFARGGVIDDWALDPAICFSGQPVGFRGVDLCGSDGCIRLKLSQTEGPHLTVYEPHPVVPREFTPDDCDHFRVTFERTPAYVADVRVVNGTLDIECRQDARAIFGRVEFTGCH